jgi:hypothetical protein
MRVEAGAGLSGVRASISPGARFCKKCGAAIGEPAAASTKKPNDLPIRVIETPASEKLEGERKTVTAAFSSRAD